MPKNIVTKHIFLIALALSLLSCAEPKITNAQKWQGVDEVVIEKVAEEQGRKAWKPLINTDQGDLLLFLFLVAGALGGFIFGFYWRGLFGEKKRKGK